MSEDKLTLFHWYGVNIKGIHIQGRHYAPDLASALQQLQTQGITLIKIKKSIFCSVFNQINSKDITILLQNIATLLKVGIELPQALDVIASEHKKIALVTLVQSLKIYLTQGHAFHYAIAKYSRFFDELTVNLIKHSEETGELEKALTHLANYAEKKATLKKNLLQLMFYPIVILCTFLITSSIFLIYIVPQFATLYQTFNTMLPCSTKLIIRLSGFLEDKGFYYFLSCTIVSFVLFILVRRNSLKLFQKLTMKIPFIYTVQQKILIARIARILGTSLNSGIAINNALTSVVTLLQSPLQKKLFLEAQASIASGQSLYIAFKTTKLFPSSVIAMLAIGEASGTLANILLKIASNFEKELENLTINLSRWLEPAIILVLGIIIGFFVLSMYLPIFKLGAL
jgi:type IV pilus assembly protein PilC